MIRSRAPIGHTCPDIDAAISMLEDLRTDNSRLRDWGEAEESKVDELENQVSDLESKIQDLENRISELEFENSDLENKNLELLDKISDLENQI